MQHNNKSHENAVQAPERGTWGNSEAATSAFVQKEPSHADDNLTKATTLVGKYVVAIKNAYREDSFYKNVNEETVSHYPNYRVEDGLIYVILAGVARLCIPAKSNEIIRAILHNFHASDVAGHPGIRKCYERIRKHFYWNCMFAQIESYIRSCVICQKNKPSIDPQWMIRPLDILTRRMGEIRMDFVSGFPTSSNCPHDQITMIIDRLTKKVLLYAINKQDTAVDAARSFINNFVCEYGLPDRIISDRDTKFTLMFWKELAKALKIRLGMSTAFHPQTDGQTERVNRVIIEMLRTMGVAYHDSWA